MKFQKKNLKEDYKLIFWVNKKNIKALLFALIGTIILFGMFYLIKLATKEHIIRSPLVEKIEPVKEVEAKETDAIQEKTIWEITEMYSNLYGLDYDLTSCILECESGGDTNAVNGIHVGAWQYRLDTWVRIRKALGKSTVDLRTDKFESTVTTIEAFSKGYITEWECYYLCQ